MLLDSKVVVLSAIAAALSVGAVQLAAGHDLTAGLLSPATTSDSVNRPAKADRAQVLPSVGQTKTISLRLSQFADTSFLLRIPAAEAPANISGESMGTPAAPSQLVIKSDGLKRETVKRPIACEPSVSILTEIAKSLQPGRCVT
ncbi:hypothetical protein [Bradyrhizobium sp. STM 3557]|uniref:hypothetical protein n=1 Tax=Bradyrhizobium sp. STM 3557 TaxID=578920 RepID=UPI00388DB50D